MSQSPAYVILLPLPSSRMVIHRSLTTGGLIYMFNFFVRLVFIHEINSCHSGDLNFMFGNFGQAQAPFRDSNDLLFSQLAVDFWTSFARTFNPNPSFLFLAARGYTNTTESLLEWGQWNEVTTSASAPLRLLDIPLKSSPWLETAQCDLLGFPLSFYYK